MAEADFSPMIREYFAALKELTEKYGEKIILLYQVGSFYESYAYMEGDKMIGRAKEGAGVLNIIYSRKNKALGVSATNPAFFGFQLESLGRMLPLLLEAGYIVPVYNQNVVEKTKRYLYKIYTPGSYVEEENNISNKLVGVTVIAQRYEVYGCVHMDVYTGEVKCAEERTIDGVNEFVAISMPKELLIYTLEGGEIEGLEYNKLTTSWRKRIEERYNKLDYQQELIGKIYVGGVLSPIENIGLELYPAAVVSLCLLLQYIYETQEQLLARMHMPQYLDRSGRLHLINDVVGQLDVCGGEKKSLYDILNFTGTGMGRRYLRKELMSPTKDEKELERRYEMVESLMPVYKSILSENLRNVYDLGRLFRRMETGMILPYELVLIHNSLEAALGAFEKAKIPVLVEMGMISASIKNKFILSKISETSGREITAMIFPIGCKDEIDKIRGSNEDTYTKMNNAALLLNSNYPGPKTKYTKVARVVIEITGGSYIKIKKKHYGMIKEEIRGQFRILDQRSEIMKVTYVGFERSETDYSKLVEYYMECIGEINKINHKEIIEAVGRLDFLNSLAAAADTYKYVRPRISEENKIEMKGLRHPIVERIHEEEKYVPNDIRLGYQLLYGINACGKSVLLKSVGLAVIMAQIGSYVAASEMSYRPRSRIYTRVTYEDNLHKNMSSFIVEMTELKQIISGADALSLVLGDEICKGTENVSATAIVAAAVTTLVERKVPFIFTSHLHDVAALVEGVNELKIGHLSVEFDNTNIIYERKIKEGSGPTTYGVEVCRGINMSTTFINECYKYRNKIEGKRELLLPDKRSVYNNKVFVDKCALCGETSTLETHHIEEQHTADERGYIGNYHKNMKFNLVVLCEKCHQGLHKTHGTIVRKAGTKGMAVNKK